MPNVYEVITERIIKQLESRTAPWHKPWKVRGKSGLPRNLVSGREYRGINVWTLLSSGYASPCWLTFRQALQLDGHVRQGEAGSPIVYWKFGRREVEDFRNGAPHERYPERNPNVREIELALNPCTREANPAWVNQGNCPRIDAHPPNEFGAYATISRPFVGAGRVVGRITRIG